MVDMNDFMNYLEKTEKDYAEYLEDSIKNCESPIEEYLATALRIVNIELIGLYNPFIKIKKFSKQEKIKCEDKTYRADFFISVEYKNQETINYVIECDGHEFHQKSKEQVERDNRRTRNLQKAGYNVIRFSGTEIYCNALKCAKEVLNIILSKCKYTKED